METFAGEPVLALAIEPAVTGASANSSRLRPSTSSAATPRRAFAEGVAKRQRPSASVTQTRSAALRISERN